MTKSSEEQEQEDEAPPEEMIECSMCHQRVPITQSMTLTGRRLCFGCAGAWFDEDESDY